MVDLAHHWGDQELMCPVYVDDEGTPAEDVTMIDRGVLRQFMHSRETAARLAALADRLDDADADAVRALFTAANAGRRRLPPL
jgi:hypothetical protein